MDGREATEFWEKLMQMGDRIWNLIRQTGIPRLAGGIIRKGAVKLGHLFKRGVGSVGDFSAGEAVRRVEKDGPTSDTFMLGEFNREDTEKIAEIAKERGIRIAVSEKNLDIPDGNSIRNMSEKDIQAMNEINNEIAHYRNQINKISLRTKNEKRKNRKIKACNENIKDLQKDLKKMHEYHANKSYTVVVNASHKQFINEIKENMLDLDTRNTLDTLRKELSDHLQYEEILNDFKDVEQAYHKAQEKETALYNKKEEKQREYDALLRQKEAGGLPEAEQKALEETVRTKSQELTNLKNEWFEQHKIANLAKEAYEKKTFSGEFTKENLKNAKGNVSMSMDKYDITHFPEGYASFSMTSEQYYNLVHNNQESLCNMPYAAFKQTSDSQVEVLCSSRNVQEMSKMVEEQTDKPTSFHIHYTGKEVTEEAANQMSTWRIPLKDEAKLQEDINLIADYHSQNKGNYMMDVSVDEENKPVLQVHSTLSFDKFENYELEMEQKRIRQQQKQRDEHFRAVNSKKVYDFVHEPTIQQETSKAQERQLNITNSFYMDENSKYYDPKKQEFLESHNFSPEEIRAYSDGFMQGLSTDEAESIFNENVDASALNDIIGDFLDGGQER